MHENERIFSKTIKYTYANEFWCLVSSSLWCMLFWLFFGAFIADFSEVLSGMKMFDSNSRFNLITRVSIPTWINTTSFAFNSFQRIKGSEKTQFERKDVVINAKQNIISYHCYIVALKHITHRFDIKANWNNKKIWHYRMLSTFLFGNC